jgi:hypothetical protein
MAENWRKWRRKRKKNMKNVEEKSIRGSRRNETEGKEASRKEEIKNEKGEGIRR